MHRSIVFGQKLEFGIEHRLRALRGGPKIEVGERFIVHCARENREVATQLARLLIAEGGLGVVRISHGAHISSVREPPENTRRIAKCYAPEARNRGVHWPH